MHTHWASCLQPGFVCCNMFNIMLQLHGGITTNWILFAIIRFTIYLMCTNIVVIYIMHAITGAITLSLYIYRTKLGAQLIIQTNH